MPDLSFDPTDAEHTLFVAEFEIEHEDVFHLKNIYKLIYEWFAQEGFHATESEGDDKIETLYMQRVLQNGNNEHHIWWRANKTITGNPYYKYFLKLDFQTLNMGKSEVTHRNQKLGTNKGDLILRCKAYVIIDYKKEWREHPFLSKFGINKWFSKRLYKKKIDYLKTDLWLTTYKLQDVIKQYMKLKNPVDMPKPFHPELGL